jgi:hypothetical protein
MAFDKINKSKPAPAAPPLTAHTVLYQRKLRNDQFFNFITRRHITKLLLDGEIEFT